MQHTTASCRVVDTVVNQTTVVAIHNLACQVAIEGIIDLASIDNLLGEINKEVATNTVVDLCSEGELGRVVVVNTVVGYHLGEELDREVVASTVVDSNLEYLGELLAVRDKVD